MSVLTIAGGAYSHPSVDINNQRCVNMFPISAGPEGRGGIGLIPTAGLELLADIGISGAIRQMISVDGDVYFVVSNKVYKLNFNPYTYAVNPTELGTINTSSGTVGMAANPTQIIIVDGTATGYICTIATGVVAAITDPNFPPCDKVIFVDGYFMVNRITVEASGEITHSNLFYVSAINNGTDWDPLDVANAEGDTDNIIAFGVSKGEPWLLGERSIEIWYNAANASGMPFSIRRGLTIRVGCSAPDSVVAIDDQLMFLDSRGYIVQAGPTAYIRDNNTGYQLDPVSTDALTAEIALYTRIDDAIGMTYIDRGHIMYQITFPSEQKTWVYDINTRVWHERNYYNQYQHLAQFSVQSQNQIIMGGFRDCKIYRMSPDLYTDDGAIITRIRTTAPQYSEFKFIGVDRLDIRMETGDIGTNDEPYIQLRYSHDGSHTWSDHLIRSFGVIGEYAKSISWNRLGTGREWVFEFTVSAAVPFTILDAAVLLDHEEDL